MDLQNQLNELMRDSFNGQITISEFENKVKTYAESYHTEQLLQADVMRRISIHFDEWDYSCGDGCCTTFGTRLVMNGKELEHPDENIDDNSYVGDDIKATLRAVLKELGYEVDFV